MLSAATFGRGIQPGDNTVEVSERSQRLRRMPVPVALREKCSSLPRVPITQPSRAKPLLTRYLLQKPPRAMLYADYSGVTPQASGASGDMSYCQVVSIIQASHGTALFTLSCGNLCCSDYSGVTLKSILTNEIRPSDNLSATTIVCARSELESVQKRRLANHTTGTLARHGSKTPVFG